MPLPSWCPTCNTPTADPTDDEEKPMPQRVTAARATQTLCDYPIRLAGQNADGTPLGQTYGGDTTRHCRRPGTPETYRLMLGKGADRHYETTTRIRCDQHRGADRRK